MKQKTTNGGMNRLIDSLGACLNPDAAEKLLALKADPALQKRLNRYAKKCSAGTLTARERAEYEGFVYFGTFVALLKSKARQLLAQTASLK